MACVPFDESHTAEHIYERIMLEIMDWDIVRKVGPVLRDNASNMVAAFQVSILSITSWLGRNISIPTQSAIIIDFLSLNRERIAFYMGLAV